MADSTRFVEAAGLRVGYDEHGDAGAQPLILLHGATSAGREDWAAQVPRLAREFHLYLPDARGHATTAWDVADGWSAEQLVADLDAFLAAVGLGSTPIHLGGFSMGAHTALAWAAVHPGRVRSLLLCGISTQPEPRASVARRLMDPERIDRDEPEWAALLDRRHAAQGAGAWRRLLPAIAREIGQAPPVPPAEIRRITAPALVAVGDRDVFAPVEHAAGLARQLPDGGLLVIPDCPHELMVRRAALFNEALAAFYRSVASGERSRSRGILAR